MKDAPDIWWGMYQEHCTQGRHHEQQRAVITGFFSAVTAGVLSVITADKCLDGADLPLAAFLVLIGLFGALFSAKQYERFALHMERARSYRDALESAVPDSKLKELKTAADAASEVKFPRLGKLRLNRFWIALHLIIAGFGGLLVTGILTHELPCPSK
jgi:hypothetical protein